MHFICLTRHRISRAGRFRFPNSVVGPRIFTERANSDTQLVVQRTAVVIVGYMPRSEATSLGVLFMPACAASPVNLASLGLS